MADFHVWKDERLSFDFSHTDPSSMVQILKSQLATRYIIYSNNEAGFWDFLAPLNHRPLLNGRISQKSALQWLYIVHVVASFTFENFEHQWIADPSVVTVVSDSRNSQKSILLLNISYTLTMKLTFENLQHHWFADPSLIWVFNSARNSQKSSLLLNIT